MIPSLTKKSQIRKSIVCASKRGDLKEVILMDDNQYAISPYFRTVRLAVEIDDRDEVAAKLFDISLTRWVIVGIHRRNRSLEILLSENNHSSHTNLDADVVEWISDLFSPACGRA